MLEQSKKSNVYAIVLPLLVAVLVPLIFFRARILNWWNERYNPAAVQQVSEDIPEEDYLEFPDEYPDSLRSDPETPPESNVPETVEVPQSPAPEKELTLREAEGQLEELCGSWSNHSYWSTLLHYTRPLLAFVRLLDDVSQGQRPLAVLGNIRNPEPFTGARGADGRLTASESSLARYNFVVEMIDGLDMQRAGKMFIRLEPALNEAYHELGYQDGSVRMLLDGALRQILELPLLTSEPELVEVGGSGKYDWADPFLQGLNPVQKLFLRLGQKNVNILRRQAETFGKAAELWAE